MATLTEGVKRFIVQALACYDSPTTVAESVKEEFGLEITRMQVAQYDPSKNSGRGVAKKWQVLFEDTRKRFREEAADIPIAQRAYRLRTLDRLAAKAEKMRNLPLTLQVLEQAAKEVGESYVNKSRSDNNNGPRVIKVINSPDED
jgi:hypothetical protein